MSSKKPSLISSIPLCCPGIEQQSHRQGEQPPPLPLALPPRPLQDHTAALQPIIQYERRPTNLWSLLTLMEPQVVSMCT